MTALDAAVHATIALLPGDGIGPEVTDAGRAVLEAVADRFGHRFAFTESLIGGAAIDAAGDPLPVSTVQRCRSADAVLLGAVGGPRWDDPSAAVRPEQGLLGIRRELGLFANLRPVRAHPSLLAASPLKPERLADTDFVVVRELTGGIYFGAKSRTDTPDGERASDECSYTTVEIERTVRVAADLARARRGRLASVDKANVLETSRLWRRVATRVLAEEYPELEVEHLLVDACAMALLLRPASFDVLVMENMFGDILTDEAAVLAGSIGVLPSASIGAAPATAGPIDRRPGLYEPIHGSAPDLAGLGVANPIGAILSAALLLRHSLGLSQEAAAVEAAVDATIRAGVLTRDVHPDAAAAASTTDVTERILAELRAGATAPGDLARSASGVTLPEA